MKNCKIVQDLLPNYIDGLTNEETNLFIENHLKECSVCKNTFENMKQELDTTKPSRNSKEVKYLKKFNKKLLILRVLVFILLIVALGVMTYHYTTMKNAYFKASNTMVEIVKDGIYPNAFYATIEEISDSGIYGTKEITVKGLNINDKQHRGKYSFYVPLDNIGDNFKIRWNGNNIDFNQLKVGQTVAVYDYADMSKDGIPKEIQNKGEKVEEELTQVRMIIVLDDTL